jgi:hypothetical protein
MSALARARERRELHEQRVIDELDRLYDIETSVDATAQEKAEAREKARYLREQEYERSRQRAEVEDAYRVISAAINGGRTDDVRLALTTEHSTLLGQLWNAVTDAAEEREHDGRVERIHEIVQGRRNPFI